MPPCVPPRRPVLWLCARRGLPPRPAARAPRRPVGKQQTRRCAARKSTATPTSCGFSSGLPVERGVDPAADDNGALGFAAKYGHADGVKALLDLPAERGVDASASQSDALYFAASNGHAGVVELPLADRTIALADVAAMAELYEFVPAIAELLTAHVSNYA